MATPLVYYLACACGCGCEANARDHFGAREGCGCAGAGCACVLDAPGRAVLDTTRGYGATLAALAAGARRPGQHRGCAHRSPERPARSVAGHRPASLGLGEEPSRDVS